MMDRAPIIARQLADAGTDLERAAILLACPVAIVLHALDELRIICDVRGFRAGEAYCGDVLVALLRVRADGDWCVSEGLNAARVRLLEALREAGAIDADEGDADESDARADYDVRGLGNLLRARIYALGCGWRAAADAIGVTITDLSRICAGQSVAVHKVIAVCDWLGVDLRRFYRPPSGSVMFHGGSTETVAAPDAGARHGAGR